MRQIGLADSRLALLGRAIRWIRGHYDETLRVEELAALATMSVSSFHRHFRAVTSMTPIQYQKQIRLHEARTRIVARPEDVAGAGFAVGYESPSQFSREYRRMFGVPPSRMRPRCVRSPWSRNRRRARTRLRAMTARVGRIVQEGGSIDLSPRGPAMLCW